MCEMLLCALSIMYRKQMTKAKTPMFRILLRKNISDKKLHFNMFTFGVKSEQIKRTRSSGEGRKGGAKYFQLFRDLKKMKHVRSVATSGSQPFLLHGTLQILKKLAAPYVVKHH